MECKVNYIVGFYIGPNRSNAYYKNTLRDNPLFFMDSHLKFLETAKGIDLTTFVFNDDIDAETISQISLKTANIPRLEVVYRKNSGFSYGIWNDTIERNRTKFNYFFLIEDDYVPSIPNFLDAFLSRCKDNIFYVCGLATEVSNTSNFNVKIEDGSFFHSAISNGLISCRHVNEVYEKTGCVFRMLDANDYNSGYINQLYYLKNYTDLGFVMSDTTDQFSSPYMDSFNNSIKIYGDANNPSLIEPIVI